MNYCKDAKKLFDTEILCGKDCPLYKACPYILLNDMADKAAKKLMREIIRVSKKGKRSSKSNG